MDIATLLSHFDAVSTTTDGYLARCPAHADTHPSLRLWIGEDRKARLSCRAGCKTQRVIDAARLRWPDLFNITGDAVITQSARPSPVGIRHIAALRCWLDSLPLADDAAAYAERRFGLARADAEHLGLRSWHPGDPVFGGIGKVFAAYPRLVVPLCGFDGVTRGAQGRDISGQCPHRWVSLRNPKDSSWALYGVLRASQRSDIVIVAEGPGDALTAVAAGFDAVIIRGASLARNVKLCAELATGLQPYEHVIAAGDSDPAGQDFNRALANGLRPHGIAARGMAHDI